MTSPPSDVPARAASRRDSADVRRRDRGRDRAGRRRLAVRAAARRPRRRRRDRAATGRRSIVGAGSRGPRPRRRRPVPVAAAAEWRTRRSKAIDPLLPPLLKRAKRRAQDDQNALARLGPPPQGPPDRAAGARRRPTTARDAWVKVLRETLDRAYGAGRTAAGASGRGEPRATISRPTPPRRSSCRCASG